LTRRTWLLVGLRGEDGEEDSAEVPKWMLLAAGEEEEAAAKKSDDGRCRRRR
jgi:hypothetical protein